MDSFPVHEVLSKSPNLETRRSISAHKETSLDTGVYTVVWSFEGHRDGSTDGQHTIVGDTPIRSFERGGRWDRGSGEVGG